MNIAIISESTSAEHPESFVKAHKDKLAGNIHFLYGSSIPKFSEKEGNIAYYPRFYKRIFRRFLKTYRNPFLEGMEHYLQKQKIDVALIEYGTTAAQVYPSLVKLNIPFIVHFHGYDASVNEVIDFHKVLYAEMFRKASYIISVSREMSGDLIKLGAPIEKVVYNPYGPNEKLLEVNPDYSSNSILAVGRFIDKKAPYYTLEAFRLALMKQTNLHLKFIGGGYLLNTCKNLVKYWGIEKSVSFLNKIPHEQVINEYKNVFCFVQHSITADNGDKEGTPVAILEAMAAALPIISTIHAGIPDVVDSSNGFIVEEHDVKEMAEKIIELYNNKQKIAVLGMHSREKIRTKYSTSSHINILNTLIKQITLKLW